MENNNLRSAIAADLGDLMLRVRDLELQLQIVSDRAAKAEFDRDQLFAELSSKQ